MAKRLKPLGWRVLVKPNEAEEGATVPSELAKLGFEVRQGMDAEEIKRSILSLELGTIVKIGDLAWMRQDMQGNRLPEFWEPWAKVGDKVIFNRYSGKLIRDPENGSYLMQMNDEDIQDIIEDDNG